MGETLDPIGTGFQIGVEHYRLHMQTRTPLGQWYDSCLRSTDIGSRGPRLARQHALEAGIFDAEHIIPGERGVCDIVAWWR